ncbi:MAG: TIGR03915 family putative DNA repair protein [Pyrinomonadaceae bacterium]
MIHACIGSGFEEWRTTARSLIAASVRPDEVIWTPGVQGGLFQQDGGTPLSDRQVSVPGKFIKLAEAVACFDDAEKWDLLYRILFRVTHGERNLLEIESDADISRAKRMEKAVNRDVHKFHAFVRFRQIECEDEEIFGAWYEPHHLTVERATPFFVRRFGSMKFSIFTPKGCAHWDKKELTFSPAADRSMAPSGDEMEDFWLLYYRSIFNPFRLKINAMKKEFPKRHWATLAEAVLIPDLIRSARESG